MALTQAVGGSGALFVGEDKTFTFECIDTNGNPVNIAGWNMLFTIRRADKTPDPPIFQIVPIVQGTFNAVRASNTQRGVAVLTAAQMATLQARTYRQSWKRMDASVETVLERGDFIVEIATNYGI